MEELRGKDGWHLKLTGTNGGDLLLAPHELINEFEAYYNYAKKTPLVKKVLIQKTGDTADVELPRVMTIQGFCFFTGIHVNTFSQYAKDIRYKNICDAIKNAIYVDKFEKAAVNLYNAPMIMRDIGLHDTVQHNLTDKRKDVSELFPSVEEIDAVVVEETTAEEIKKINEHGASDTNEEANQ